ncbi:MAG: Ig-like domain-containing protein [Bacteroidota bacterium]|nr:Ig-like domain-containing protein [Bacteroidota bacterium]
MKTISYSILLLLFLLTGCRGPEGPAGPPGPNIEALTDPSIMPKVIATYPPANSTGPYDEFPLSQIQIRFNKIMDRASVKRALSLKSNRRQLQIDTNSIQSIGGDIFTFYATEGSGKKNILWKIQERGTLRIAPDATDINGNVLGSEYIMTFMPESEFRVVSVYPADGAIDVPSNDTIRIRFNSPVSLSIDNNISSSIQIIPSISDNWKYDTKYTDNTAIYLVSSSSLLSDTIYAITVFETAKDTDYYRLPKNFTWNFRTASFNVKSTFPKEDNTEVPLYGNIDVSFTSMVDWNSVKLGSGFKIDPYIDGYFDYSWNSPALKFIPAIEFAQNTWYNVTLDTVIQSKQGEHLKTPYQFSFKTAPLKVLRTAPSHNRLYPRSTNTIEIEFNAILDTSTIRSSFQIVPWENGEFLIDRSRRLFVYHMGAGLLRANQEYIIRIGVNLSSIGQAQFTGYEFRFRTGG